VFNYARRLLGSDARDDALAVASAFHDIGIWTDGTWDYLPPSIARATEYIEAHLPQAPAALVADIIDNHHRLTRVRGRDEADVVEAFRSADLADVSFGILRAGLDAQLVKDLAAAFPYAGFHAGLVRAAVPWIMRHPWKPLPMLRW
jgi:L-aminopeptidase/D-esterase-like protein